MRSGSTPRRPRPARGASSAEPKPNGGRDPLLAAICHDLRAPLASVTMGASFVLQTTPEDEEHTRSRRILEAMLRSCAQMERLVRNFGDLSEIEGDAVALRLGVHDAGEMLEIAAHAAEGTATARRVAFEIEKPDAPLAIRCDRDRVLRAIGQVIDNAVKHAPEGGTVTLAASSRGTTALFCVTDRGPGLAPEVRRNLFDRHFHAKRAGHGSGGFGLAVARGFAAAHGGRLDVTSRPSVVSADPPIGTGTPGETTFTIALPIHGPPDGEATAHAARLATSTATARGAVSARRDRAR